jgi:hypothetical protein
MIDPAVHPTVSAAHAAGPGTASQKAVVTASIVLPAPQDPSQPHAHRRPDALPAQAAAGLATPRMDLGLLAQSNLEEPGSESAATLQPCSEAQTAALQGTLRLAHTRQGALPAAKTVMIVRVQRGCLPGTAE